MRCLAPKCVYSLLYHCFSKMASIVAGREQGHSEKTSKTKYDALMQLEREISNKDIVRNVNVTKNTLST